MKEYSERTIVQWKKMKVKKLGIDESKVDYDIPTSFAKELSKGCDMGILEIKHGFIWYYSGAFSRVGRPYPLNDKCDKVLGESEWGNL